METEHKARGKIEFPSLETPAIIAMKGLPCTNKTWIASRVAKWARCPIIRIDDILDKLYGEEAGDNGDSSPSRDEAERLHRRAFDILCDVAASQLRNHFTEFKCVVIKSRLCSTLELDRLFELAAGVASDENHSPRHSLLIIECQMRNEHRWREYYNEDPYYNKRCWYTAKNWDEVEMARCDYDAQAWDDYFLQSLMELPQERQHLVRRLVLDSPYQILGSTGFTVVHAFADAIEYLLTGDSDELRKLGPVVEYDELRRSRLEQALIAPRERSKYLCTHGGCFFKYCEALEDYEGGASCCGVCEEQVSGHAGYACHFCSLALHKSCAELDDKHKKLYLDGFRTRFSISEYYDFPKTHACNSCKERGKVFSYECIACIFQTHLKCRMMPTIIYHPCHVHFLSIRLAASYIDDDASYVCKACGLPGLLNSYVCKLCNYRFQISCIVLPREVKHEHGGYEHRMKLMYSLDGMEEQEDLWCDVCYKDIDPELWFYSCQECPYYVAHVDNSPDGPCSGLKGLK